MRISLDGVLQAPSGPEEDPSEHFKYGGWTVPYSLGDAMSDVVGVPFDLLLGRKTYEVFAAYWPHQSGWDIADSFSKAKKYVVSNGKVDLSWKESIQINDDVVTKIKALKAEDGPMLQVYGSSVLIQTLLEHDLVDELWLNTYPVTLGQGKKLFGEGTIAAAWELTKSETLPSGIVVARYKRAGDVKTER